MFIIYRIINTVNKNSYIGFTSKSVESRWLKHQGDANRGSRTHFHNVIRKYGVESFKLEILEEGWDPKIGLEIREPYWISVLKPEYNTTLGGEGVIGYEYNKQQCQRISDRMRGKQYALGHRKSRNVGNRHALGTKRSLEQNQATSKRLIGHGVTLETREKMSRRKMGIARGPSSVVTCPCCYKEGGINIMHRWHFDNCKKKS